MQGPDYHRATNAAYELLREMFTRHRHIRLETDVLFVFELFSNVSLISYTDACTKYGCKREMWMSVSDHGFTIKQECNGRTKHIVFFNDWKDDQTIRFTLAHEIGHIVLNHSEDNNVANKEANCFARNFLCPVYVRSVFNLNSCHDYCSVFNVSEPMAQASMGNASLDYYHIDQHTYIYLKDALEIHVNGYTYGDLWGFEYA